MSVNKHRKFLTETTATQVSQLASAAAVQEADHEKFPTASAPVPPRVDFERALLCEELSRVRVF